MYRPSSLVLNTLPYWLRIRYYVKIDFFTKTFTINFVRCWRDDTMVSLLDSLSLTCRGRETRYWSRLHPTVRLYRSGLDTCTRHSSYSPPHDGNSWLISIRAVALQVQNGWGRNAPSIIVSWQIKKKIRYTNCSIVIISSKYISFQKTHPYKIKLPFG